MHLDELMLQRAVLTCIMEVPAMCICHIQAAAEEKAAAGEGRNVEHVPFHTDDLAGAALGDALPQTLQEPLSAPPPTPSLPSRPKRARKAVQR